MPRDEDVDQLRAEQDAEGDESGQEKNKNSLKDSLDIEDTGSSQALLPFNPAEVRIALRSFSVDYLLQKVHSREIDMAQPFARSANLWSERAQSRLIESLLIRIPIGTLYIDATSEEKWVVLDGLQRLTSLRRFIIDADLILQGLQFLTDLNGRRFHDLPRALQRRIEETVIPVHLIEPGTPEALKFHIFERINSEGLALSAQEMRHALNPGPANELLKRLAQSEIFLMLTPDSLRDGRMLDRECILRFLAFYITPPTKYTSGDFDGFLHEQMRMLNRMPRDQHKQLEEAFLSAMNAAVQIFDDKAFRRLDTRPGRHAPFNKALFEAWSVNLAMLSHAEIVWLVERKNQVWNSFNMALGEKDFNMAVTQATGDPRRVRLRFERVSQIIREVLAP